MTYKLIIFDFDGVIVNPNSPVRNIIDIIDKLGILDINDRAEDLLKSFTNLAKSFTNLIESLLCVGQIFNPCGLVSFAERYSNYKSNDKVVNFIKNRNGYKMAIFSINTRRCIEKHLEEAGILEKFDVVISCEDVKKLKPNLEGLKKILKITKVRPHEAIYFGSGDNDRIAAENAQIKYVSSLNNLKKVL